jgi:tetratricopeptide (TPR) repeat protein
MMSRRSIVRYWFCSALLAPSLLLCPGFCQAPPVGNFMASAQQTVENPIEVSPEMQGDLLAARKRYLDAIAAYRQGPENSAVIANKIGVAYHHMFDIADARKSYERAIKLNPKYAEAINNLGAIYHSEKNYKQAERLYRKAIKLNPNSPLFYSNLGTAYFFEGNSKKGAEAYRQAFALDPEVFERGAGSKIEEGSTIKDMAQVNYVLAKTYAQAGMNELALNYLRKALGEGFNDRRKLMNDREFASVRETPEFLQLLSMQRSQ